RRPIASQFHPHSQANSAHFPAFRGRVTHVPSALIVTRRAEDLPELIASAGLGPLYDAPSMSSLLSLSLVELAAVLKEKKASPVELMQETFARVDRNNPQLNAIVVERDRDALLADARAAEQRIALGTGRPFEGIPLGVKDLEDAAGLPTSYGSKPFRNNVAQ